MGRRVESGRDGVLSGGALAQEMVGVWIMNDRPVLERVRDIMAGSDGYRSDLLIPAERVQAFVTFLLYSDDGSTYRRTWRTFYPDNFPASGFESRRIHLVRSDFTRADFDRIDWAGLAGDLREEDSE